MIIKAEYKKFELLSVLNLNNVDQKTSFKVYDSGSFIKLDGIKFYVSGEYLDSDGKTNYWSISNVKMIDNFPAFLWGKINVKFYNENNTDWIENVGQLSTVTGIASYVYHVGGKTERCGFKSNFNGEDDFEVIGHLSKWGNGWNNDPTQMWQFREKRRKLIENKYFV